MKPSPYPYVGPSVASRLGVAVFGAGLLAALVLLDWRPAVAGLVLFLVVAVVFAPRGRS